MTPESSTLNTNTQLVIEVASPILVSSSLWGYLSPSTKKKVKSKLQKWTASNRNEHTNQERVKNQPFYQRKGKQKLSYCSSKIYRRLFLTGWCYKSLSWNKKKLKKTKTIQMKKCLFAIAYHHYPHCIRSLLQRVHMIVVIRTSVDIVHVM